MGSFLDQYFWVLIVAFFMYFAYSVFTKHGRGRMFGGQIVDTIEPHIEKKQGLQTTKIKVHVIRPSRHPDTREVGIEISNSAYLSWSMLPIALEASEAKQLVMLLQRALSQGS